MWTLTRGIMQLHQIIQKNFLNWYGPFLRIPCSVRNPMFHTPNWDIFSVLKVFDSFETRLKSSKKDFWTVWHGTDKNLGTQGLCCKCPVRNPLLKLLHLGKYLKLIGYYWWKVNTSHTYNRHNCLNVQMWHTYYGGILNKGILWEHRFTLLLDKPKKRKLNKYLLKKNTYFFPQYL